MHKEEIIEFLQKVVEKPDWKVREWKEQEKGKAVGFLLTDVPEELIHAAGFFPYGISGGRARMEFADAHLQSWTCSFVRSSLSLALEGKLDFLDGLIIPQTCDTTRNVSGIWQHANPLPFLQEYRLPRQVDRPSARNYLIYELNRLKEELEKFSGRKITEEKIKESIALYNDNRNLLARLFVLHEQNPAAISNRELYTIIEAALLMPVEILNKYLNGLIEALENEEAAPKSKIRLFISGTLLEPLEILDFIDENGGLVVGDDLKNGSRYIDAQVQTNDDPLAALADRQLKRIPGAFYDPPHNPRRHFLVKTARDKKVQGVIFLHLRNCEPENYDFYDNMQALEESGIPAIRIETEFVTAPSGQIRTRVEAFLEMIGGEGNV
ncbi:MAG: 2-hydroxyacyl-CoA dehydratase [Firmicutes bacterium]|nr:2-hydroxyacyl-CoA dehydratase [Bacillota bacterium]